MNSGENLQNHKRKNRDETPCRQRYRATRVLHTYNSRTIMHERETAHLLWILPPSKLITLPLQTVHLWKAPLTDRVVQSLIQTELPSCERNATKSKTSRAARAVLRNVLSRYVGTSSADVQFHRNQHGKPFLTAGPEFNVSHTDEVALIAIADRSVGVDIERRDRRLASLSRLLSRLDPKEATAICAAADPRSAFISLWTRKEAFIKCTGQGIQRGLSSFRVSIDHDIGWLLSVDDDYRKAGSYWTSAIDIDDHYAAFACEGPAVRTKQFLWQ